MEQYSNGLSKAYENPDGLYREGDTLYIAGTRNLKDVSQWPLIVLHKTRMDEYLKNNPDIKNLVGHSAAGAAILEKQKETGNRYNTITYGSPTLDTSFITKHNSIHRVNRYANFFDPVALLDFSAQRSFIPRTWNPHSASNAYRQPKGYFNNEFVSYSDKRRRF